VGQQWRNEWEQVPSWERPPYHAIEMKIGEELRERFKPPQEMPHQLLTLIIQIGGRDKP
jgi:hypothetical protein